MGACPTQYLMELSFADCGIDWRAITVEVQCSDLEAAIHGAEAMGLRGLRFFEAAQMLASEALVGEGFGLPISSARLTDTGWKTWHSAGSVLRDVIDMHLPEGAPCELILFGDTPQTRSIYGALVGGYSIADEPILQAVDAANNLASFSRASWVGVDASIVPAADRLTVHGRLEMLLESRASVGDEMATCLVGCEPTVAAQFAGASRVDSQQKSTSQVLWLPTEEHVSKASSGTAQFHQLSRSELFLRGEQEDFFRWTGQRVDLALLRDAYDEFSAF